jgi:hypothetical protein
MAGWLYADVFLALMIMGVGSSVVVKQIIPSDAVSSPPAAATALRTRVSCQEFAVLLDAQTVDGTDAQLSNVVTNAISGEIVSRGWSIESVQPALVIVLGGFELYESAGDGDVSARSFRTRLRGAVPMLANVEMRTGGARSTAVDGVQMRVGDSGEFALVVYVLHPYDDEQDCE